MPNPNAGSDLSAVPSTHRRLLLDVVWIRTFRRDPLDQLVLLILREDIRLFYKLEASCRYRANYFDKRQCLTTALSWFMAHPKWLMATPNSTQLSPAKLFFLRNRARP